MVKVRVTWFSIVVLFAVLTVIGILAMRRFETHSNPVLVSREVEPELLTFDRPRHSVSRKVVPAIDPEVAGEEDSIELEPEPLNPSSVESLKRKLVRTGAWENEGLLTFRDAHSLSEFLALAKAAGVEITGPFGDALTLRARFGSLDDLSRLLQSFEGEPPLVDPNFFVSIPRVQEPSASAAGDGHTPFGDLLFKSLGIPEQTDRSTWGKGVVVAVVDSGISDHPTFREGQVKRIDLVGEEVPMHGHGTAMGSLIAGNADTAPGMAPGASLLDIRIAGEEGLSDSFLLAQGIQTAIDQGADIVNISLGTYGDSPLVRAVTEAALKQGIVVVAPVGNEMMPVKAWPAAYPGVVSVSGVDAEDRLAYFSNSGGPTLAAPAVGIISAYTLDHQPMIAKGQGTSQASALVSGVMAQLKSRGLDPVRAVTSNTRPIRGNTSAFGVGILHLPASAVR